MTRIEIEALAESVLRSFGMWRLPVDPLKIIAEEDILAKPGCFGGKFDARIEFYPEFERFCIFYEESATTSGRVRFSLAHELGHYYLPDHNLRLRSGEEHFSNVDYRSRDPHERQADEFAAGLLMPRELFLEKVEKFRGKICDLENIKVLAEELGTSITSTALRYCTCDIEPATIIFSKDGKILWSKASEDMKFLGLSYMKVGGDLPDGSCGRDLIDNTDQQRREGEVDSEVWFDRPRHEALWEDSLLLGDTTYMLTLLTPSNP